MTKVTHLQRFIVHYSLSFWTNIADSRHVSAVCTTLCHLTCHHLSGTSNGLPTQQKGGVCLSWIDGRCAVLPSTSLMDAKWHVFVFLGSIFFIVLESVGKFHWHFTSVFYSKGVWL
jgi:hypothetical protein